MSSHLLENSGKSESKQFIAGSHVLTLCYFPTQYMYLHSATSQHSTCTYIVLLPNTVHVLTLCYFPTQYMYLHCATSQHSTCTYIVLLPNTVHVLTLCYFPTQYMYLHCATSQHSTCTYIVLLPNTGNTVHLCFTFCIHIHKVPMTAALNPGLAFSLYTTNRNVGCM